MPPQCMFAPLATPAPEAGQEPGETQDLEQRIRAALEGPVGPAPHNPGRCRWAHFPIGTWPRSRNQHVHQVRSGSAARWPRIELS